MKRIVAKEFLLLVGCFLIVLLVALFGWLRNAWLEQVAASAGSEHVEQSNVLDSLSLLTVPTHLDFLNLFEPEFIHENCDVFITSPFWTYDPFLVGLPNGPLSEQYIEYRERVYTLLNAELNSFNMTKKEFEKRIDSDPEYGKRIYGILCSIYKDVKRPKEEFLALINAAQSPDPFKEFGGQQDGTRSAPQFNRRYLICIIKALDKLQCLTPDRLNRLATRCGRTSDQTNDLKDRLVAYKASQPISWRPPADAAEVYNPSAPESEITTWEAALVQRGVPKIETIDLLQRAQIDTASYITHLIAIRGVLCDTIPYAELRGGYDVLKSRNVLRCNFDELLYTLQNKPVPPSQEAIDALAKQQATVNQLREEQNEARASIWSEAKQWAVVKWAAIVLLVLVYPLRLLVLGTFWAIKVLRK
jgi:hypothetical protein